MKITNREDRRQRIKYRIRKRVRGTAERPRLSVFRSVSHIYVQVIDDLAGATLAAASSVEPAVKAKLADGASETELADALAAEYGVSRELSEKDTADFLDVIRSAGFIEE